MTAKNYLTYLHLLTPLHTGGSADEGNLMGIAREVHTEFPYLPSSSLRGKIRAELEKDNPEDQDNLKEAAGHFFGQKIKDGNQPTEGEVWFADATLLLFPIASLSHHLVWITCPLWLDRWSRWLEGDKKDLQALIQTCRKSLYANEEKAAILSFSADYLYLQTALLKSKDIIGAYDFEPVMNRLKPLLEKEGSGLLTNLKQRLILLTDEDCAALVETGLQREVRVALKNDEKTVEGGSFRSEEAIPPEAVIFFPWGVKAIRPFYPNSKLESEKIEIAKIHHQERMASNRKVHNKLLTVLQSRLQFGGLEGLGRGWVNLQTSDFFGDNKNVN